ncbi:MAG: transposase [Bacteroidetes bacterium]|nr:transposase [Bacteroidota bacterium]
MLALCKVKNNIPKNCLPALNKRQVPRQNLYRILKEKLDLKFLPATTTYYGKEGQASIDPVVFFKLILVGYLENLNSDRKIIDQPKRLILFILVDIDEELRRTLCAAVVWSGNFATFKQVLKLCIDKA